MTRIVHNRMLMWSVIALVAYWTVGLSIMPGALVSSTMSLLLLIFGSVVFARYVTEAVPLLLRRNLAGMKTDDLGGNLSIYGVTLLSFGSCYVGLFGLLWMYFGQPVSWLGSVYSGFGRGVMAAGFAMLFFSPDVARQGFRVPIKAWVLAAALAALVAAFALGVRVGKDETRIGVWEMTQCRLAGICSAKADTDRLQRLAYQR